MTRLGIIKARNELDQVLKRVGQTGEQVIVHQRGQDLAAIIPISDFELLKTVLEAAEDALDQQALREGRQEVEAHGTIPLAEVRRRLGK